MTAHDPDLMRRIALERDDAVRHALESAAVKLETHATNDLYHRVLKLAARLIRAMKPA
jgi:hypothetical protein